jgi:hypothetical protein
MPAFRGRAMPRYRIIIHAVDVLDDPEGIRLPTDEAALAEALKLVRELKRDARDQVRDWAVEVAEGDRQVAMIAFATVE